MVHAFWRRLRHHPWLYKVVALVLVLLRGSRNLPLDIPIVFILSWFGSNRTHRLLPITACLILAFLVGFVTQLLHRKWIIPCTHHMLQGMYQDIVSCMIPHVPFSFRGELGADQFFWGNYALPGEPEKAHACLSKAQRSGLTIATGGRNNCHILFGNPSTESFSLLVTNQHVADALYKKKPVHVQPTHSYLLSCPIPEGEASQS